MIKPEVVQRWRQEYFKTADAPSFKGLAEYIANRAHARGMEEAAGVAWNHYADTCKSKGLSPYDLRTNEWCSAQAIRSAKGEEG